MTPTPKPHLSCTCQWGAGVPYVGGIVMPSPQCPRHGAAQSAPPMPVFACEEFQARLVAAWRDCTAPTTHEAKERGAA